MSSKVRHSLWLLSGMPRSGSTWMLRMLNELCVAGGGEDYTAIRSRFHLDSYMTVGSALIGTSPVRLLPVLRVLFAGHTFAVKTHDCPGRGAFGWLSHIMLHSLAASGRMLPIYLYRDPRDALLSAYEYGQRGLLDKRHNNFIELVSSIDAGIPWMDLYLRTNWEYWPKVPGVLTLRYEDLLTQFETQAERMLHRLGLDGGSQAVQAVLTKYKPGAAPQVGTHFYKGEIGRFRQAFSPAQQEQCNTLYAAALQQMGYPPE